MTLQKRIRVLVVDDSALVRQLLTEVLSSDPAIEVVGTAPDPIVARDAIKTLNPDVLTLDVEMPHMDGLAFLDKIMTLRPTPVVMVSSLTRQGADTALRALELGAVDYVGKPRLGVAEGIASLRDELIAKVKAAAGAQLKRRVAAAPARLQPGAAYSTAGRIVAIGASTGGVEALRELLGVMPANSPAILVTQHMPPVFTASFANRLDGICAMTVTEAKDGEPVMPGHVYIAPGSLHLELQRSGAHYRCKLVDGPLVSGHRPSVDVLFNSVARNAGANAIGVILTGMGRDGADGLLEMRRAGAATLGQSEATCVVYGMPKVARERGAVQNELPLAQIPATILALCEAEAEAARR